MLKEFKTFIAKGNVIELAVGLIMATYFGAIVKSFVNDIIMPPVGKAMGGVDFSELKVVIQEATVESGEEVAEIAIMYGNFINTIVTFVIVALCVFLIVKGYNKLKRKEVAAPSAPPIPTKEEVLLTEIRDLLKK